MTSKDEGEPLVVLEKIAEVDTFVINALNSDDELEVISSDGSDNESDNASDDEGKKTKHRVENPRFREEHKKFLPGSVVTVTVSFSFIHYIL